MKRENLKKIAEVIILVILSIFRIWLAQIQNINVAIVGGGADDWHQVKQAIALSSGKWLGKFTYRTYIKEIGYPVFCAFLNKLHISYGIGCGLLVIFISALCAASLCPLFSKKISEIIYICILFNPIGFGTSKLYRAALLGWVPLGLISCVLGIYLYSSEKKMIQTFLFGVLGLVFGAWFWILKEDSIWLLPFLVCAGIVCVFKAFFILIKKEKKILAFIIVIISVILPFAGAVSAPQIVEQMNEKYYGVRLTNDRSKGEMARLVGLLYRIDTEDVDIDRDVWVTRGALKKALEVSPHLAQLDGLIDEFESWGNRGASKYSGWPRGDMCIWALRTCMNTNNKYETETDALEFCREAADELEIAFKEGRLKKRGGIYLNKYIRGFMPAELIKNAELAFKTMMSFFVYKNAEPASEVSFADGTIDKILKVEKQFKLNMPLTDEQMDLLPEGTDATRRSNSSVIHERKTYINIVSFICKLYKAGSYVMIPVCILGFVILMVSMLKSGDGKSAQMLLIVVAMILTAFCAAWITAIFGSWISDEIAGAIFVAYCPAVYMILGTVKIVLGFACVKQFWELYEKKLSPEKSKAIRKDVPISMFFIGAFAVSTALLLTGCKVSLGGVGSATPDKELYVGFAQVGHESDWRYAETKSVKEALSEENGIKLEFVDCDNDFEVQKKAIYDFIEKGVDYIIIAPIVSTGWEEILKKAEDSNIPVIVIDRTIDDSDNYATWLGSEFTDEGLAAGEWLKSYAAAKGIKEVNIVEISGNEGSSAENGRTAGFHKYIEYEGWNIIDSRDGEFTEEGGKRIMDFFCEEYEDQFNIVVSQNDNMSFGIMQSLDEHGITYGVDGDVIIISYDACTAGLKKVLEGKINADFQCNPLQGPDCLKLIRDMEAGKEIPRENIMSETWYAAEDTVTSITYFNSMGEEVTEPIVVVDKKAVEDAY